MENYAICWCNIWIWSIYRSIESISKRWSAGSTIMPDFIDTQNDTKCGWKSGTSNSIPICLLFLWIVVLFFIHIAKPFEFFLVIFPLDVGPEEPHTPELRFRFLKPYRFDTTIGFRMFSNNRLSTQEFVKFLYRRHDGGTSSGLWAPFWIKRTISNFEWLWLCWTN